MLSSSRDPPPPELCPPAFSLPVTYFRWRYHRRNSSVAACSALVALVYGGVQVCQVKRISVLACVRDHPVGCLGPVS